MVNYQIRAIRQYDITLYNKCYKQISIRGLSYSDYKGEIQIKVYEMCTNPGPQNTFETFIQNCIFMYPCHRGQYSTSLL